MRLQKTELGFALSGDIDIQMVTYILSQGNECISATSSQCICIDLSEVGTCTIASLVLVVSWQRLALAAGKGVRLIGAPNSLQQMLLVTGLTDSLQVSP